jgi:hypothetical protein
MERPDGQPAPRGSNTLPTRSGPGEPGTERAGPQKGITDPSHSGVGRRFADRTQSLMFSRW